MTPGPDDPRPMSCTDEAGPQLIPRRDPCSGRPLRASRPTLRTAPLGPARRGSVAAHASSPSSPPSSVRAAASFVRARASAQTIVVLPCGLHSPRFAARRRAAQTGEVRCAVRRQMVHRTSVIGPYQEKAPATAGRSSGRGRIREDRNEGKSIRTRFNWQPRFAPS